LRTLKNCYPDAKCELNFSSPEELLIATILSAQSTDRTVNSVTRALFSRFPVPAGLAKAKLSEIERIIRPCGYYRQKARSIRETAAALFERYHGTVPPRMEDLLTLRGVARKTANVVLSVAFGINEGVAVDTHVARLSGRLGLSSASRPEAIEKDLMTAVARDEWGNFTTLLITHGRSVCNARKPHCSLCGIDSLCPSAFRLPSWE
jgi:endonuclease-3